MARYPFESEYLYGLHDPGGEHLMREAGCPGWILFTEEIGHDPAGGRANDSYPGYRDQGFGLIVRLNNGYYNSGTIPHSSQYENFARRCAHFVRHSPGANIWIVGNETNMAGERPGVVIDWGRGAISPRGGGAPPLARDMRDLLSVFAPETRGAGYIVDPGEVISPQLYARCYALCRQAIRDVPGHADDLVLVGAVAPWNIDSGDWIAYLTEILERLGPQGCDGISVHTYTHGTQPGLVQNPDKMASHPDRHYHFRAYQDFMHAIPHDMRHLPVYLTETDQDEAWSFDNLGWVQRAYEEIDRWNQHPGHQQIRAMILYRWQKWPNHKWWITGNRGVIDDFKQALQRRYRWNPDAVPTPPEPPPPEEPPPFTPGQEVEAVVAVNVRRAPGYLNQPDGDVLGQFAPGARVTVLGAAQQADGLTWWPVRGVVHSGETVEGWTAQVAPNGQVLLT